MAPEKVSIIIPVYNVAPYLAQCLDSAVNQDYDNLEIIAIDDGSTDASLEILETFRARHGNLTVRSTRNQGVSIARNTGLELATGEYILFVDSDDFLERQAVSTCVEILRRQPVDMIFFASNVFFDGVDESLRDNFRGERAPGLHGACIPARTFFSQSVQLGSYLVMPYLYMYRRKEFEGLRFYPKIVHEDELFTTRLLLEKEHAKVTCIPEKLYNRRVRPGSIMTQKTQQKHINGCLIVAKELLKLKLSPGNSEAAAALNKFIQLTLLRALEKCKRTYAGRLPLHVRGRLVMLFARTKIKRRKVKHILVSVFPELLALRNSLRKNFRSDT
ncbi:glycosyltransferase family 2 protein [Azotobacter chroococcum]|nr:glycosyltransferase family A protein [Azotobacter chroococcum]QQE90906.1 glycosyltransferase family 2 protein [Azotobacter chroococcum]TBW37330.1 glycosyltransferase family 2 protein [Azotobacter chroococcum]TKD35841.1 glycosyltransferase family 2 protein [Azotobacter chroococcum]